MIGQRGSLRFSGDRNCKRFLPYLHLQRSIPPVLLAAVHSSLRPPIALGGDHLFVLFNALPLAKNEHC